MAPTYNHAPALAGVLAALAALPLPVIVVNDGSTDGTAAVLADWRGEDDAHSRAVIAHATNLGKAAALRSGFREAARRGFTHAVTIDTDGQHDPRDLFALIEASRRAPGAIVVGARPRRIAGYPLAGRIGRAVSNRLVRLIGGVRVGDSQSGMRAYPLAITERLAAAAERYGYETEILVRAGWAGVPVIEAPIRCVYAVPGGRVSHFRVVRDSLAAARMHARLLGTTTLRVVSSVIAPGIPTLRVGSWVARRSASRLPPPARWGSR